MSLSVCYQIDISILEEVIEDEPNASIHNLSLIDIHPDTKYMTSLIFRGMAAVVD